MASQASKAAPEHGDSLASMFQPTVDIDAGVVSSDIHDGASSLQDDVDGMETPEGEAPDSDKHQASETDVLPEKKDESGADKPKTGEGEEVSPELEARAREIAEEVGLDPDTNWDALLKLAGREVKVEPSKPAGEESDDAWLTPFEKELADAAKQSADAKPGEAKPGEKPAATSEDKAPEPMRFGDLGDEWKSLADGHNALSKAWESGDVEQVALVDNAIFDRQYFARGLPVAMQFAQQMIEQRIQKLLSEDLADVVTETKQSRENKLDRAAREAARKDLEATPLKKTIEELFKPDGGKPVVIDGEEYDPIPYNRLVAQHRGLLKIKADHQDPEVARRLTITERYREAARLYDRLKGEGKIASAEAQALVKAGAETAKRDEKSRTRQRLNAGGKPAATSPKTTDFADRLVHLSGGQSIDRILRG